MWLDSYTNRERLNMASVLDLRNDISVASGRVKRRTKERSFVFFAPNLSTVVDTTVQFFRGRSSLIVFWIVLASRHKERVGLYLANLTRFARSVQNRHRIDPGLTIFQSRLKRETKFTQTHHINLRLQSCRISLSLLLVFILFALQACASDRNPPRRPASIKIKPTGVDSGTCSFQPVGHLNYEYAPGLIIPLADGRILAMGGAQQTLPKKAERFIVAEDGKRYGDGAGMVELFDPKSGQTKVLTKMPFAFSRTEAPTRSQIGGIQLRDGRIFLSGVFIENRDHFPGKNILNSAPMKSPTHPQLTIHGVSPATEPRLFAVIYDWRNAKFEFIKSPPEFPARTMSTFHLLPDGRVVILGGADCINAERPWKFYPDNRVLVFDPRTKKISVLGKLRHDRFGHKSLANSDGTFLLFGGFGPSQSEALEKYCIGRNPDGRCVAELPVIHTKEVERFDPSSGKSTIVAGTLTRRDSFNLLELPNHKVLIHGGPVSSLLGHEASELYDVKSNISQFIGEELQPEDPDYPRFFHGEGINARAGRKGGRIVLAEDEFAFIYRIEDLPDSAALKRNQTYFNLLEPREEHHIIRTPDDRLFIVGGTTAQQFSGNTITNPRAAELIEEFITQSRGR